MRPIWRDIRHVATEPSFISESERCAGCGHWAGHHFMKNSVVTCVKCRLFGVMSPPDETEFEHPTVPICGSLFNSGVN